MLTKNDNEDLDLEKTIKGRTNNLSDTETQAEDPDESEFTNEDGDGCADCAGASEAGEGGNISSDITGPGPNDDNAVRTVDSNQLYTSTSSLRPALGTSTLDIATVDNIIGFKKKLGDFSTFKEFLVKRPKP